MNPPYNWLLELEMVQVLKSKADPQGKFTPESVWTAWKDWEFGQKKVPSRWLTLFAWRIIERVETMTSVHCTISSAIKE